MYSEQLAEITQGKCVISFSLWGKQAKYLVGAIRNAELCQTFYPGWVPRFYVATDVSDDVIAQLKNKGAEIVETGEEASWHGQFWRFLAAQDQTVSVMLSRDCDSRFSQRETQAVVEWLNSSAQFHIMRDHPAHTVKILAGMWGAKQPLLHELASVFRQAVFTDRWQADQDFLAKFIYPRVRNVALTHDEFYVGRSFPTQRQDAEFVGQVFDEYDQPNLGHQQALRIAMQQKSWRRWYRKLRIMI